MSSLTWLDKIGIWSEKAVSVYLRPGETGGPITEKKTQQKWLSEIQNNELFNIVLTNSSLLQHLLSPASNDHGKHF